MFEQVMMVKKSLQDAGIVLQQSTGDLNWRGAQEESSGCWHSELEVFGLLLISQL